MSITNQNNKSTNRKTKITAPDIIAMKRRGEKIAGLTANDHLMEWCFPGIKIRFPLL